jgi:hypothetical protein
VALSIRSFIGMAEPFFRAFKTEKATERSREEHYFGLWDQEQRSFVLSMDDWLIAYGSAVAKERLRQKIRPWVDLGMPSAASFALPVYPRDVPLIAGEHQWIVTERIQGSLELGNVGEFRASKLRANSPLERTHHRQRAAQIEPLTSSMYKGTPREFPRTCRPLCKARGREVPS